MSPAFSDSFHKAGSWTRPLAFGAFPGWVDTDFEAIWSCFEVTRDLCFPSLQRLPGQTARAFFETAFDLHVHGDGAAHFTGYYEPELLASRVETETHCFPIYAAPPELQGIWHSRSDIARTGVLRDRGLELAWLSDPVEVFFLQVQGSGRLVFEDGHGLRVGFAAKNGHPYASIGAELIRRGEIEESEISAERIKTWLHRNGTEILSHNPSYVFFKPLDVPATSGPLGSMERSVTANISLAVDPAYVPLGAPVWTEIDGVSRLCIAQDIGGAIRGPNRGDLFCGTGPEAGARAGSLNATGFMSVLMPLECAK
jgi:membrane-bound lytic murein transglycosylase A